MPAGTSLFPAGKIFAGCRVLSALGRGSSGVIYEAIQLSLERPVALKVLASEMASPAEMQALLAEARTLGQMDHPNVVRVFNAGMEEGRAFIVMELLEGETLQNRLRRAGALTPAEAFRITGEVARGLQAAHQLGIVHRDMKPSNVFVRKDGRAKVIDFGLAGADVHGGTPEFMAPEQWQRKPADPTTDLYALGLILYRMLAGRNAYSGDLHQLRHGHLHVPVKMPSPRPAALTDDLFAVLRRMTRKDSCERYSSATEFLGDFDLVLQGKKPSATDLMTKILICPTCDTESPAGTDRCSECGTYLSRLHMTSDDLLPEPPPPTQKTPPRPIRRFRRPR